jgi:hypothetical protein
MHRLVLPMILTKQSFGFHLDKFRFIEDGCTFSTKAAGI